MTLNRSIPYAKYIIPIDALRRRSTSARTVPTVVNAGPSFGQMHRSAVPFSPSLHSSDFHALGPLQREPHSASVTDEVIYTPRVAAHLQGPRDQAYSIHAPHSVNKEHLPICAENDTVNIRQRSHCSGDRHHCAQGYPQLLNHQRGHGETSAHSSRQQPDAPELCLGR